jgi:hypothetical protein
MNDLELPGHVSSKAAAFGFNSCRLKRGPDDHFMACPRLPMNANSARVRGSTAMLTDDPPRRSKPGRMSTGSRATVDRAPRGIVAAWVTRLRIAPACHGAGGGTRWGRRNGYKVPSPVVVDAPATRLPIPEMTRLTTEAPAPMQGLDTELTQGAESPRPAFSPVPAYVAVGVSAVSGGIAPISVSTRVTGGAMQRPRAPTTAAVTPSALVLEDQAQLAQTPQRPRSSSREPL